MAESPLTEEEARRRMAARVAGLPLTATWREIAEKRPVLVASASSLVGVVEAGARQEERDERELEWQTQQKVVALFQAWGGDVWPTSQRKRVEIRPGLADLLVFFPKRRATLFWETKRPVGGRYSPAQLGFASSALAAGSLWGGGALDDAQRWLVEAGWAEWGPTGVLEPIAPREAREPEPPVPSRR